MEIRTVLSRHPHFRCIPSRDRRAVAHPAAAGRITLPFRAAACRWVAALLCLTALHSLSANAAVAGTGLILHVDPQGPESGDGLSWKSAMRFLNDALAAADTLPVTEIRVAAGIQRPDRGANQTRGDRYASFAMRDGVWLRGGFAGLSGRNPDERDLESFPSILCGDLLDNDVPRTLASRTDNSYHVVTAVNAGTGLILEGFTVRRGHGDGVALGATPESKDQGSGANVYDCNPVFIDCIFEDNHNDNHGAINDHGNSVVIRCTFRGNTSNSLGAGLYSHHHAATCAVECVFEDNLTTGEGAGAYSRSMHAMYSDCTFIGNVAGKKGGGFYGAPMHATDMVNCVFIGNVASEGGGVYSDHGMPKITHCRFEANNSLDGEGGGGLWNEGGAGMVMHCEFVNNVGNQGGAVYNRDSEVHIESCAFIANHAFSGGGVWNQRGMPYVGDCVFLHNTAQTGGGLYNDDTACIVASCIFTGNSAIDGDGGGGISNSFESAPTIIDCVFIENLADNIVFGGGGGVVNYVSSARLVRCVFLRNRSTLSGGAIYNELDVNGVEPIILNCRFEGNVSTDGGAIQNFRSNPRIIGCTFVGNRAETSPIFPGSGRGGAIMNHFISRPLIIASTITGNHAVFGGGMHSIEDALATIEGSIIQDNHGASGPSDIAGIPAVISWSILPTGPDNETIIRNAAIFERTPHPGPDGIFGTRDDDYGDLRLAPGSPGIDAGRNAALPRDQFDINEDGNLLELLPHDLAGAPRFSRVHADEDARGCGAGAIVDLGAHEHPGDPAASVIPEDLTGDGAVGPADLLILLSSWGPCAAPCCPGDFTGDGGVDLSDLLRLLGLLGR